MSAAGDTLTVHGASKQEAYGSRRSASNLPSYDIVLVQGTPAEGDARSYRLLIHREDSTDGAVTKHKGDFNITGWSLRMAITGQYTNLELVDVNISTSQASVSLTSVQLCSYLISQKKGGQLAHVEALEVQMSGAQHVW